MHDEENEMELETVTITDDSGRTLVCSIEHSLDLDGEEYVVLLPVDTPVEIVYWQGDDDDDDAIPVEDDSQIDLIFPTAKVVLEEQNIVLKRTAVTLTVEGELPDLEDEDDEESENGLLADEEELQFLASFYYEEQEYGVYAPLDAFLILARMDADQPKLLSKDELEKIEPLLPMIEEQLFESFE